MRGELIHTPRPHARGYDKHAGWVQHLYVPTLRGCRRILPIRATPPPERATTDRMNSLVHHLPPHAKLPFKDKATELAVLALNGAHHQLHAE